MNPWRLALQTTMEPIAQLSEVRIFLAFKFWGCNSFYLSPEDLFLLFLCLYLVGSKCHAFQNLPFFIPQFALFVALQTQSNLSSVLQYMYTRTQTLQHKQFHASTLTHTHTPQTFFCSTSQTAYLFPCSPTDGAGWVFFLPPYAAARIRSSDSQRVASLWGTFERALYQLSHQDPNTHHTHINTHSHTLSCKCSNTHTTYF